MLLCNFDPANLLSRCDSKPEVWRSREVHVWNLLSIKDQTPQRILGVEAWGSIV